MTIKSWPLFLPIALAAALSPGPALLVVTTNALQYGPSRTVGLTIPDSGLLALYRLGASPCRFK